MMFRHLEWILIPYKRYSLVSFWAPNYDYVLPDSADRRILAGEYYLRRNDIVKC